MNTPDHDEAPDSLTTTDGKQIDLRAPWRTGSSLIGGCIDGGACHHACTRSGGCFRQSCCVPLSGSGLGDDWRPL